MLIREFMDVNNYVVLYANASQNNRTYPQVL